MKLHRSIFDANEAFGVEREVDDAERGRLAEKWGALGVPPPSGSLDECRRDLEALGRAMTVLRPEPANDRYRFHCVTCNRTADSFTLTRNTRERGLDVEVRCHGSVETRFLPDIILFDNLTAEMFSADGAKPIQAFIVPVRPVSGPGGPPDADRSPSR